VVAKVRESDPKTVIFFDGSCPLCRTEINYYRRRDRVGALCLVDVSVPGAPVPPGLDRDKALSRFHVVANDGKLLSGAAAFAEVWKQVPGWRYAGRLASLPGFRRMLELCYRLFLLLRPALVRAFVLAQRAKAISRARGP
jgi:predicted DCC family thiol-disulfide oxidoreductase YuxK